MLRLLLRWRDCQQGERTVTIFVEVWDRSVIVVYNIIHFREARKLGNIFTSLELV